MLNLNSIMLSSPNYKNLANFYGKVLDKKPEMVDEEHGYIGYLAGNCFISICAHDKVQDKNQNPERIILFFESTDVQVEFDRIKQIEGVEVIKEPYSPNGSNAHLISTLADPDGNYFQVVTPWDAK
ncbi:MAG TPA: VOC family protein [Candidatus Saccharimonadales bacterium]